MTLTTSYQKLDEKYLGNTGYGNVYIRIYARVSSEGYDIANNRTKVYAKSTMYIEGNGNTFWSNSGTYKSISCTGLTSSNNVNANGQYYQGETTLQEISGYVTHDDDGTKTITASGSWSSEPWGWSATASGSATLPPIPRYATISHSLYEKKMDGTVISWSSDSTIDYIWAKYKKSSESSYTTIDIGSVNASSGRYTILGLTPNTWYDIITIVRRKDSQLTTESSKIQIGTLNIPLIASAPNFTDEDNPKITYTNTSGNEIDSLQACISWTGAADIDYRNINKTGTLEYTFNFTDAERKKLRQACTGTSMQVTFYVRTRENGQYYYSTLDRTMTIVNAKPVFTDFDWEITNYSDLTGNNNTVIKGFSSIKTKISNTNKAAARKEASLISYKTVIGTKNKTNSNLIYPVETIVNDVDSSTIQVYANDSRGNSIKVEKNISNFIDLLPLNINRIEVKRSDNNDEEVNLKIEGIIDTVDFGQVVNAINRSRYYYKRKDSSTYTEGSTNLQFTYEKMSGTQYKFFINQIIEGDIEDGFSSNGEYDIKVTISDKLTEVTKETSLEQGSPAIAILGNNVALGAPYDTTIGGRVQVNGEDIDYAFVSISPDEPDKKSKVWIQKSKNSFDKNDITSGKYISSSNGELGNLPSAFASGFIEIKPNTSYYWNDATDRGNQGAFYDEKGVYISGISKRLFTTPNNAKYVRLTGLLENLDTMQLEQGTTATPYEPYIEKKIYTKNDNGIYEEFYKNNGIIESGSNENGSWVKFADGTMICRHIANMGSCTFALHSGGLYTDQTNGGYYNWKLPQLFIDRYVEFSALAMSSAYMSTSSGGLTSDLTNINIYYHTNYACTVGVSLSMKAIGRWK